MKRKTIALMTALTLVFSISACGDKTASQAEIPDTTSVEKTAEKAEVTEEESTKEEETTPEITQEEKVQSALGEMPYYGDTSKCAMTVEQATAFAQLIADGLSGDFSFRGGYNEDNIDILTWGQPFKVFDFDMGEKVEVDRFNVMLGDFASDGVPYLYLYSTNNSVDNQSYEIYGWADNAVKLVHDTDEDKNSWRFPFYLYEDGNNQCEMKIDYVGYYPPALYYEVDTYAFSEGTIKETNKRVEELKEDELWHVTENDAESVYTEEEYNSLTSERKQENHTHTVPYTCFYDMTPCTLEEMVNYLNVYATAMSDGQSVPVEIKKVDIVKHDGTGITTKGEVSPEKVNSLEILRQFMNGENCIVKDGGGEGIVLSYVDIEYMGMGRPENFYFDITDLNNDGNQEILVSYKDDSFNETEVFLPSLSIDSLIAESFRGVNKADGTYLVATWNDAGANGYLYVYDGTTFSEISALYGDIEWEVYYGGKITENGATRDLSEEEFYSIWNYWESKHTDFGANIHLDIENIENTFQVKIDVQSSGEWLVTNAE